MRQEAHEELNGHIILEIDGETAREIGWESYVDGIRVWQLDNRQEIGYNGIATDGRGFFDDWSRGRVSRAYR